MQSGAKRFTGSLTIILALVIFAGLIFARLHGDTLAIDSRLSLLLRDPLDPSHVLGPSWLREAVRDLTSLGSVTIVILLVLVLCGYLLLAARRAEAVLVASTVAGAGAINTVLKLLIAAPRPGLVADAPMVFTTSFPSGHAALSAGTCICLAGLWAGKEQRQAVRIYIWTVCLFITLWLGVSRVYLGVHWPSDVVAGWCVGAAWGELSRRFWDNRTRGAT